MTSPVRQQSRRLAALVAIGALVAGCTGDGDEITLPSPEPSPSATEEAAASPSPSPTDPFAVPDEITPDYVERVLNELNRLDAELTKEILGRPIDEDATQLPVEDKIRLQEIYEEPILTLNTRGTLALLRSRDERNDLVPLSDYEQLRMPVEMLLTSEPCLIARVDRDFSAVDAVPDTDTTDLAFVFLVAAPDSNDTGWRLASLLESDAAPDSADEEELRALTAKDLLEQAPESCG